MISIAPSSPRAQRRLCWAAGLFALTGALAAAAVVLPKGESPPETSRPGRPQIVHVSRTVPLTPDRRRMIDSLFDRFVPSAVERKHPLRALALVTRAFRAGVSRREWSRGNLPVLPYHARGEHFHGWTLDYSFPHEIGVDLLLHPAPNESLGAIAFTTVLKRVHGRWLIDSFFPAAAFAPQHKKPGISAQPDFAPLTAARGDTTQLSTKWLLVPAGILALILLVPIGFGAAHLRRSRRAWRTYQAQR